MLLVLGQQTERKADQLGTGNCRKTGRSWESERGSHSEHKKANGEKPQASGGRKDTVYRTQSSELYWFVWNECLCDRNLLDPWGVLRICHCFYFAGILWLCFWHFIFLTYCSWLTFVMVYPPFGWKMLSNGRFGNVFLCKIPFQNNMQSIQLKYPSLIEIWD